MFVVLNLHLFSGNGQLVHHFLEDIGQSLAYFSIYSGFDWLIVLAAVVVPYHEVKVGPYHGQH